MAVETRYVAGSGVLLGAGDRWLLVSDPGDEGVVEELWSALAGPEGDSADELADRVLAIADRAFDGAVPGLALVDLTPGSTRSVSRGTGTVTVEGPDRVLTLDEPAAGPDRRLLGGVVSAASVRVRRIAPAVVPAQPGDGRTPAGAGLIDGIPADILAAKGPDGPPARRTSPVRASARQPGDSVSRDTSEPDPGLMERVADAGPPLIEEQPARSTAPVPAPEPPDTPETPGADGADGDHDGSTVLRPEHLTAGHSGETVEAVWCPLGHQTPPTSRLCRICRAQVAPQHPQRVPRPVLGGLRLPSGEVVPLDRAVVLGRRPQPVPTSGEWPHLVTLPAEHTFVSRMHLHLAVEGWHVVARDLGSRGGTTLKVPGAEPLRMVPEQAYVLEPGHVLDLADTYEVRFEVGPPVGASQQ